MVSHCDWRGMILELGHSRDWRDVRGRMENAWRVAEVRFEQRQYTMGLDESRGHMSQLGRK